MNNAGQAYWSPSEIQTLADGLGRNFLVKHGQWNNLKNENLFEEHVMKHFKLTTVASVERAKPCTQNRLDELKGRLKKNLMTMYYNGSINVRVGD